MHITPHDNATFATLRSPPQQPTLQPVWPGHCGGSPCAAAAAAMSFVYLGGDDASLPTYFEVLAADRLVPSLKAAVVYVLSVRPVHIQAQTLQNGVRGKGWGSGLP
eukprot:364161-Chlamydomonas_euryale.AAC.2